MLKKEVLSQIDAGCVIADRLEIKITNILPDLDLGDILDLSTYIFGDEDPDVKELKHIVLGLARHRRE